MQASVCRVGLRAIGSFNQAMRCATLNSTIARDGVINTAHRHLSISLFSFLLRSNNNTPPPPHSSPFVTARDPLRVDKMSSDKTALESACKREGHDDLARSPDYDSIHGGAAADSGSSIAGEEVYQFDESRKLGITSSVFLILNKMIGTGSEHWLFSQRRHLC